MSVNDFINKINSQLWGWPLILLILGVGILLTLRTGAVQVFHLGKALKYMVKNEEGGKGEVSSFGALCTALAATIGTGNIIGVAMAICAGGPGALFWMIVSAFLGMATKYAEGLLAVKYRVEKENGRYLGGPFYYIEKGMGTKWRWLGKIFAFFGLAAGVMGIGTITQISGITAAAEGVFDAAKTHVAFTIGEISYTWATVITGILVTSLAALVIIGGVKRIAGVSQIIIPFMAIFYSSFALLIVIIHFSEVPAAIVLIVKSAFAPKAALGAAAGISIKIAMQKGIGRGIFSNEAGLGSAPIAAAAAKTRDPVRQGLVTMTGTFIDTIVICTMTGLSIILTGAYQVKGLEGIQVTTYAWQQGLPFPPAFSSFVLMLCLTFFAFTTILGWVYYAERCLEYLMGKRTFNTKIFRWFYIAIVFIGPYLTVEAVWGIADIFNGLMALPNLIALLALSGVVRRETKAFGQRAKMERDMKKLN